MIDIDDDRIGAARHVSMPEHPCIQNARIERIKRESDEQRLIQLHKRWISIEAEMRRKK